MRKHARFVFLIALLASLGAGGCANANLWPGKGGAEAQAARCDAEGMAQGMTQARMERIFSEQVAAIEGPSGALRTIVDGVEIYLVSDPANDRMRMMSRIAPTDRLPVRFLNVLLEANFHSTLDARYAIWEDVVYGLYLHPISTLTPEEIKSAYEQVLALAKNFGTTFSSGKLEFPAQ